MHLLDRIAAFAIVLQFIMICLFSVFLFVKLDAIQATLQATAIRVVTVPAIAQVEVTPTPSVTSTFKAATGAALTKPVK